MSGGSRRGELWRSESGVRVLVISSTVYVNTTLFRILATPER